MNNEIGDIMMKLVAYLVSFKIIALQSRVEVRNE